MHEAENPGLGEGLALQERAQPTADARRRPAQNVPVAVDGATADTALFLMLGALRQFGKAQHNLRDGAFNAGLPLSNDPEGKTASQELRSCLF